MGGLTPDSSPGRALVVNAGSTSLKVAVFGPSSAAASARATAANSPNEALWSVDVDGPSIGGDRVAGFESVLRSAPGVDDVTVVGHRVVHGGMHFDQPTLVDAEVEAAIEAMEEFAPLHNRAALDGLVAARRVVASSVPQVAVFDTAFHRTLPTAAAAYGGPKQWLDQDLRRFGFHGISHQEASRTASAILGRPLQSLRMVTCHLGGGCSLAAVDGGRSVDTTMGFTPLDGLVMTTRAGAVDPGLILYLLRSGTPLDELQHVLEEGSGLLGLSGISADLREIIDARDAGNGEAALSVDVFVHRVATGLGAMIAALGGVDAIVFTGGIGENSPEVRRRVTGHFGFVGVELDDDRNEANPSDVDLSAPGASVRVLVVRAGEERAIARAALGVVGQ